LTSPLISTIVVASSYVINIKVRYDFWTNSYTNK